jgi:hypothetical protein
MFSFAIRISLAGIVFLAANPETAFAQPNKFQAGKAATKIFTQFASDLMAGVVVPYLVDRLPKPEAEMVEPEPVSTPPGMPPAPAPAPEASPPVPAISATGNYTFHLEWTGHDGPYSGILSMSGATGVFRVWPPDGVIPDGVIIDQDMEAVRFQGSIWLLASNLRYAPGTTRPEDLEYWPDNFRLVQRPDGEWAITETCDEQNEGTNCSPVRILGATPF